MAAESDKISWQYLLIPFRFNSVLHGSSNICTVCFWDPGEGKVNLGGCGILKLQPSWESCSVGCFVSTNHFRLETVVRSMDWHGH